MNENPDLPPDDEARARLLDCRKDFDALMVRFRAMHVATQRRISLMSRDELCDLIDRIIHAEWIPADDRYDFMRRLQAAGLEFEQVEEGEEWKRGSP